MASSNRARLAASRLKFKSSKSTRDTASTCAINNLPAHNRRHHLPRELPAIKRSVVRQRPRPGGFESPALLGVENSYVGEVTAGQRSAAAEIKNARWSCREELDDASERNLVFAVKFCHG